ncbi:MAG: hypothetical protein SV062_04510 [Thermodesulfobacteriota bacterium]|nr:hypothetical protein [Thermodesulfobacteriota bacterium]
MESTTSGSSRWFEGSRIQGVKGSRENLVIITLESWNPRPLAAHKIKLKSSPKGECFSPIPRRRQ